MYNSPWWKASVGYILYPAAFADSNGDGVGDLPGVIAKLDYLQSLGIDLIWMHPICKSPMDDNGYDVSSYYEIDPRFGNIEDFKRLLQEAHARGIRILIDFVLNHTSDEHPWFQKALKEPDSEERGYYFFAKGKKEGDALLPPNNWKGFFSTSVWQRVEGTEDYYMHIFSSKMPDVNWANPALREKYYEIARFYLDLGVDGFRIGCINDGRPVGDDRAECCRAGVFTADTVGRAVSGIPENGDAVIGGPHCTAVIIPIRLGCLAFGGELLDVITLRNVDVARRLVELLLFAGAECSSNGRAHHNSE